jgi:hypothetical protein
VNEFWKIALGVAGLGSVAAFVLWSLYRQWLTLRIFQRMTRVQQFRIFVLFLVLTFLFAAAGLVTYAHTHSTQGTTPVVHLTQGQEETHPVVHLTQGSGSISIDNSGASPGGDNIVNVTQTPDPELKNLIKLGIPQDDHPVIDLARPIGEQVQLFPQDRVRIYCAEGQLRAVWFGGQVESFSRDREYLVQGRPGIPVTPKFWGHGGNGSIKLAVYYTRNRDLPRYRTSSQSSLGEATPKKD